MGRKSCGGVLGNTWSTTTTTITNHERFRQAMRIVTMLLMVQIYQYFFQLPSLQKDITFEHVYRIWIP